MTKLCHAKAARQSEVVKQRQQLGMMFVCSQLCYGASTESEVNTCLDAEGVVCKG